MPSPDEIIDRLLDHDIGQVLDDLKRSLPWVAGLDEVRQRVLVDMAFNLGVAKLLTFKQTLAAVQAGKYDEAADHMLQSKWAGQVCQRSVRLAHMMRTGQD